MSYPFHHVEGDRAVDVDVGGLISKIEPSARLSIATAWGDFTYPDSEDVGGPPLSEHPADAVLSFATSRGIPVSDRHRCINLVMVAS